jgi:L-threonylcarbamoyladenylate synthase
MLMTTTQQAASFMIQRYDLEGAAAVLENEGLLLLPTDALWCVACLADDPVAIERLRRVKKGQRETTVEILFSSLKMLKEYAPLLHPRLETLLAFHRRPLTILTEAGPQIRTNSLMPDGRMAARVVHDQYCRGLIKMVGRPLATTFAHFEDSPYPDHFGRVRSDIIESVDYVAKYRPREASTGMPTIMVQLDQNNELEFLRD